MTVVAALLALGQAVPLWRNSSLAIDTRLDDLLPRLRFDELQQQLNLGIPAIERPGLSLPGYSFAQECLAGVGSRPVSSAFPLPVNLGSSFDESLVATVAAAISDEARAYFNTEVEPPPSSSCSFENQTACGRTATCLAPNLNVARDPRWGRNYETFSEDPLVIASLGTAYIRSMQGNLSGRQSSIKINAVPKHIGVYSVDCYNASGGDVEYPHCPVYRSSFNAIVSSSDLHDTYLTAWKAAVQQGSATGVMCSYNAINGIPACADGKILNDLMRLQWGFDGISISDSGAIAKIFNSSDGGHFYVKNYVNAVAVAVNGGCDIDYGPTFQGCINTLDQQCPKHTRDNLFTAVNQGLITKEKVSAAARRSLKVRMRLGMFDEGGDNSPWRQLGMDVVDSDIHRNLSATAASASYVLLKHDEGTLPLRATPKNKLRIAVLGPAANSTAAVINRYTGSPSRVVTMLSGITARAQKAAYDGVAAAAEVVYIKYWNDASKAVLAVTACCDVAVAVLTAEKESESHDRERLGLPVQQAALLSALGTAGVKTVLVLVNGGAVDVTQADTAPHVGAIIETFQGGQEAGTALASLLFGDEDFSGAMPITVYRESFAAANNFTDMAMTAYPGRTHRFLREDGFILYPFGHGLSYAHWKTTLLGLETHTLSIRELKMGAIITLKALVSNVPDNPASTVTTSPADFGYLHRGSSKVVHAYICRSGKLPFYWPVQWLVGFSKLHNMTQGASRSISFAISQQSLMRWDPQISSLVIYPGTYYVWLGGQQRAPCTQRSFESESVLSFEVTV